MDINNHSLLSGRHPDEQDRALEVGDDTGGDAASDKGFDALFGMRAHDDQIGVRFANCRDEFGGTSPRRTTALTDKSAMIGLPIISCR